MRKYLKPDENGYGFFELLFDERIVEGELVIPQSLVSEAGGINTCLKAKRKYELVLRIAESHNLRLTEMAETEVNSERGENSAGRVSACSDGYIILEDEAGQNDLDGITTDCYIIAKYRKQLIAGDVFNPVIESLISDAESKGLKDKAVSLLEGFLSGNETFYKTDDCTRTVLIFKGNDTCYDVLNTFADELKVALEKLGCRTEIFDVDKKNWEEVAGYRNKHYKAVVGFQSFLFSVKMADGKSYLADFIKAPKYNFLLDAPVCFESHLGYRADDFTILTHDVNYKKFLEKYYNQRAAILPPGGMVPCMEKLSDIRERNYSLSFLGSYGDYRKILLELDGLNEKEKEAGLTLFEKLKEEPELTLETGFAKVLAERGLNPDDETFLTDLHPIRRMLYAASYYFREKAVGTILDAGLELHVFGESYRHSPFARHPGLHIHEEVTAGRSLEIYCNSKLSLNFMTWHKAGFTERMANIMLSGAVLVTDHTDGFPDGAGRDFIEFNLRELHKLPLTIKNLLEDEQLMIKTAENGRKRALASLTWDKRAEELLELIENNAR